MNKKLLLLAMLNSFTLFSQIIFTDDFSSYSAGQPLSGQGSWTNNSSLNGGLGSCSGFGCLSSSIVNASISYPNYGNASKSLSISSNQDAVGTTFTGVSNGTIYLSFVVNFSAAINDPGNSASQDFFRVMSSGNYNTAFRIGAYNSGGGFVIFMQKGSGAKVYSSALSYNQNHLLVMKYTFNPGANDDLVGLYVDPNMSVNEPTTTIQTSDSGAGTTDYLTAIDRMNFRANFSTIPTGIIGLVKSSKTWNDLTLETSNLEFDSNFIVNTKEAKNGLLIINSYKKIASAQLKIYDIQGKLLENKTISLNNTTNEIMINSINTSGAYIIEISTDSANKFTQKILVN
jgi:hypothetical protein